LTHMMGHDHADRKKIIGVSRLQATGR